MQRVFGCVQGGVGGGGGLRMTGSSGDTRQTRCVRSIHGVVYVFSQQIRYLFLFLWLPVQTYDDRSLGEGTEPFAGVSLNNEY